MIFWLLVIGIGWLVLAATGAATMLAIVALNEGVGEVPHAMMTELPTVIVLASPGLI